MKRQKITLISTDGFVQHGVRSISAFLKSEGFDVNVIFFTYEKDAEEVYNSPGILKAIREIVKDSVFVGISTNMQVNSPLAIWIYNHIKDMNIPVVWGGIYPTINPDDCIKHFDIVCRGEGEYVTLELAQKLIKGNSIDRVPNLWVRSKGGEVIRNQPRELIADLDILPLPDIDSSTHYYLNKEEGVIKKIPRGDPLMSGAGGTYCLHGSRGCPFVCSYCSNKAIDTLYCGKFRRVRKRNINLIIEELKVAVKVANPGFVWFSDDVFPLRSDEELKLFCSLYKKHINLPFMCYVSPTTVSETKMKYLVDAGLKVVEMGVQSGSDYINKNIYERQQTNEDVLRSARILSKFGNRITVRYQFILFNEYEREKDIVETINLIKRIPSPYFMQAFTLSLFKGSELYNKYLKSGHLSSKYKMLTYTEADLAFWRSVGKMSNRKHYLYMLLWVMIQSSRFGNKVSGFLKNDRLVKIRRVPTWFCYLSSFAVVLIYKAVSLKRWLIP
ncbi:MAG: B12-binding domain-containing radical SAM protein [Nanoarchaeota archaeon]|nr:B12-binding domain-containing radical SAM protein [Nanoarchaeota archaeon]